MTFKDSTKINKVNTLETERLGLLCCKISL